MSSARITLQCIFQRSEALLYDGGLQAKDEGFRISRSVLLPCGDASDQHAQLYLSEPGSFVLQLHSADSGGLPRSQGVTVEPVPRPPARSEASLHAGGRGARTKSANASLQALTRTRERKLGTIGRQKRIFFSKHDSKVGFRAISLLLVEDLYQELVLNQFCLLHFLALLASLLPLALALSSFGFAALTFGC